MGLAGMRWAIWAGGATIVALATLCAMLWRQAKLVAAERARERRLREELEAYAQLDAALARGAGRGRSPRMDRGTDQAQASKALAMRVCRTVAEKSAFTRVMMLVRGPDGQLRCAGWVGVDDLTVAALECWAGQVVEEERAGGGGQLMVEGRGEKRRKSSLLGAAGAASVPINLGEWHSFDPEVGSWQMSGRRERRQWRRAIVVPIRTAAGAGMGTGAAPGVGRLVGAIVVCTDGLAVPMRDAGGNLRLDKLMNPLETLAQRLGTAMENEILGERLLRAEKLAGLGQLAGGVAHALNNPLTAVLGFAELIAESSNDHRVQRDARTIVDEALKMKSTIERLQDFWRPSTLADEPVDVLELVSELTAHCEAKLAERGVKLELISGPPGTLAPVRGCRERLAQVIEHLLNNSAQAIAAARAREEGEEHSIRISVTHDEHTLSLIVSDTGTGFEEPARAFDPFYTTQDPVGGTGLGLSICYGIVREHGGEIAAFNLHPHGAAVVVELPLRAAMKNTAKVMLEERLRA